MRNKKTDAALAVVIIAAVATIISVNRDRSSDTNDEADNMAVLHTTVENGVVESTDDIYTQLDTYSSSLDTNSVYDSAHIEKGELVVFAKGSSAIVIDGEMSAVCNDGLINITDGTLLKAGEKVDNNNLYVFKEEDCGLYAVSESEIFVKGGYEITK